MLQVIEQHCSRSASETNIRLLHSTMIGWLLYFESCNNQVIVRIPFIEQSGRRAADFRLAFAIVWPASRVVRQIVT